MDIDGTVLALWTAAVGFVTPLIVNVVKKLGDARDEWTTKAKQILALITSVVTGFITTTVATGADFALPFWKQAGVVIAGVWVTAQTAYQHLWKTSKDIVTSAYDEGYNPGDVGYGTDTV